MGLDEAPDKDRPDSPSDEKRPARRIRSTDLFPEGAQRVVIRHDDRDYVLIITKSGKLLLNLVD